MKKIRKLTIVIVVGFLFGSIIFPSVFGRTLITKQHVNSNVFSEMSYGNTWKKVFGNADEERGNCVHQTRDGGYIIAASTNTYDSYGEANHDIWLIKTDAYGEILWSRTYGGEHGDGASDIRQTRDGGYIIAGATSISTEGGDFWLIKTDSYGYKEWDRVFTRTGLDIANSVRQTQDGGYILVGLSESDYGYFNTDIWLIKTDSNGNMEWNKVFNETNDEDGKCVQQTDDGGYIIVGEQDDEDGISNLWLIKTDCDGNIEWEKIMDESNEDQGNYVQQTSDGGYIITGLTDKNNNHGDIWIIKTDSNGNKQWEKIYGGSYFDWGNTIQQTKDGGYIIAGLRYDDYDIIGGGSAILLKIDANGNKEWYKLFRMGKFNEGFYAEQTNDGGYVLTGETKLRNRDYDLWFVKTDENGEINTLNTPSEPYIEGVQKGTSGVFYNYTFTSTDPNDYDLQYYVDWGESWCDSWTDLFPSGEPCKISHRYINDGTYTIKAVARNSKGDISEYGTLEVSMPRTKNLFMFNGRFLSFLQVIQDILMYTKRWA